MPRISPFARLIRQSLPSSSQAAPLPRLAVITPSIYTLPTASASRPFSPGLPTYRLSSLVHSSIALLATRTPASNLNLGHSATQVRTLAYGNMYQPSQRKRKRKHGFLSRSKGGRLGRKTLARRSARGRRFLSH